MKVSNQFLTAIRNLTDISDALILRKGKKITAKGSSNLELKGIICEVDLDIDIPEEVGISDTKQFQSLLSLFDAETLEIDIQKDHLVVKDSNNQSQFLSSPINLLDSEPKLGGMDVYREKFFEDPLCSVKIPSSLFQQLLKARGVINAKGIVIMCKDGVLQFQCRSSLDTRTSNMITFPIAEDNNIADFEYVIDPLLIGAIKADDFTLTVSSTAATAILSKPNFQFLVSGLPSYSKLPS